MAAAIKQEMQETRDRFFAFISKLEEKLKEFTEAAIPELAAFADKEDDESDTGYYRMKAAVLGQLDSVRSKASATKEEKITHFPYSPHDHQLSADYYSFRNECYERFSALEALYSQCRQRVEEAYKEDYEAQYKKILDGYEAIKDKCRCMQCGSPIPIRQIYAVTTYITCPACQTRNTFDPGSEAKALEGLGRSLAEQRTEHLLQKHHEIAARAREAFNRLHKFKMNLPFEKFSGNNAQLRELEEQKQQLNIQCHTAYQIYLRAMFDEWNKINPALQEQHEKFYIRLWNEYNERNQNLD